VSRPFTDVGLEPLEGHFDGLHDLLRHATTLPNIRSIWWHLPGSTGQGIGSPHDAGC